MKAGIVLDTWKLPIFERHLTGAGFDFTESNGPTKDTLLLTVEFEEVGEVQSVVTAANNECTLGERNSSKSRH
jgi:hypothetical protein